MSGVRYVLLCGLAALLLSGCSTVGEPSCSNSPLDLRLNYGVLTFEEGNYQASMMALQGVLDNGSSSNEDRVRAYKYLAFIDCVSAREKMCRNYFRKALELDPSFDLEPAEAGHPVWGPVFRSVKSKFPNK